MKTIVDQHRRSLAHCAAVVATVRAEDLRRTTPCRDWDLGALLAHMSGQNEGFALAVRSAPGGGASGRGAAGGGDAAGGGGLTGGVGTEAFAPQEFGAEAFAASLTHVGDAFARADPDGTVVLAEVSTRRIPMPVVVGMHLVDTLVHTWDVASSLGHSWRPPEPDLVEAALEQALRVPDGDHRTRPGAAFAPALAGNGQTDPWAQALRRLGRDPG